MDSHKLAKLLAIVSVTLLGAIAITMIPFLFDGEFMKALWLSGDIELLALLLGIGLVVGVVSYVVLKLLHGPIDKIINRISDRAIRRGTGITSSILYDQCLLIGCRNFRNPLTEYYESNQIITTTVSQHSSCRSVEFPPAAVWKLAEEQRLPTTMLVARHTRRKT